jgi:hypothetical protein
VREAEHYQILGCTIIPEPGCTEASEIVKARLANTQSVQNWVKITAQDIRLRQRFARAICESETVPPVADERFVDGGKGRTKVNVSD